jgi:hypothetical protein
MGKSLDPYCHPNLLGEGKSHGTGMMKKEIHTKFLFGNFFRPDLFGMP